MGEIEGTKPKRLTAAKFRAALRRHGVRAPVYTRSRQVDVYTRQIRGWVTCFESGAKVIEDDGRLVVSLVVSDRGMRTTSEKIAALREGVTKAATELGILVAWCEDDSGSIDV